MLKNNYKRGIMDPLSRYLGLLSLRLVAKSVPCQDYEEQHCDDNDDHYEPVNCIENKRAQAD